MSRLPLVDPSQPTTSKPLLEAVGKKLGLVPNLTRVMANSPAVLKAYLEFSGALAGASLPARTRELIALAVGEANGCDYCLAARSDSPRRRCSRRALRAPPPRRPQPSCGSPARSSSNADSRPTRTCATFARPGSPMRRSRRPWRPSP